MSDKKEMMRVNCAEGKYTVVQDANGVLYAERYGNRWRECVGDNLIYWLAADLSSAREALAKLIKTAEHIDWQQVVLNSGPPCFHIEKEGCFCLRAERWEGHTEEKEYPYHQFVSLKSLLEKAVK